MVGEVEEVNNVGTGKGAARAALVFEDREARNSDVDKGLELGGFELSSE